VSVASVLRTGKYTRKIVISYRVGGRRMLLLRDATEKGLQKSRQDAGATRETRPGTRAAR
jgi:hypothetical protein